MITVQPFLYDVCHTFKVFTLLLFNPDAVIISDKQSAFEIFLNIHAAGVLN